MARSPDVRSSEVRRQRARSDEAADRRSQASDGRRRRSDSSPEPVRRRRPQADPAPRARAADTATAARTPAARTPAARTSRTRTPAARRDPAPSRDDAALPELVPEPSGRFNRLLVAPFTEGPRVRMGALWFFLALAASTSGRWWTAALWSVAAAFAAAQTVGAWQLEYRAASDAASRSDAAELGAAWTTSAPLRWIAALAAATVPLAAGWGTGLAGVVLAALAACCGAAQLVTRSRGAGAVTIAILLPAIAAASVVIAVRVDLWAGLFLILAVSLFDAGSYLMGAEAAGRWEGPVAGMIGALAVTFTMATIDPPPFDRPSAWLTGVLVAVACVPGQWAASAFLPRTTAPAPALRRLDAYIVAGPVFVACVWLLGS